MLQFREEEGREKQIIKKICFIWHAEREFFRFVV